MSKIKILFLLFKEFGFRYLVFRLTYEARKKSGLLKNSFPETYFQTQLPSLEIWKRNYSDRSFIAQREKLTKIFKEEDTELKHQVSKILNGEIPFFSSEWKYLGFENEWNIHPLTQYKYPEIHWTKIPIYSKEIGDIKYVWEKSKFSYLLYLMRNDAKFDEDHSQFVFSEIERWIDDNPPNVGPQYICSQEISIRLINWSLVLFFYKDSPFLNDIVLHKILKSVEIQYHHIFQNISFSRTFVRNNHAVTETLTLYLLKLYFPFLPKAEIYGTKGKKWFEKEVVYQVFEDGSDSQYSFNYHRVKIQLFAVALASARVHNENFSPLVIERMKKSVLFLSQMVGNDEKGYLSNFGANDGSLYFKLNSCNYRNFYPQLHALGSLLGLRLSFIKNLSEVWEDSIWFTSKFKISFDRDIYLKNFVYYKHGGYVSIRTNEDVLLFKTPEYKFRVAQDDFFHIDLWTKGKNILKDSGSYRYNTDNETFMEFHGVKGHNSFSLNTYNHLLKSFGFVWLFKPKHISTEIFESSDRVHIISKMQVYYPHRQIFEREINLDLKSFNIMINDKIDSIGVLRKDKLTQNWNCAAEIEDYYKISAVDSHSETPSKLSESGKYSIYYGSYEKSNRLIYTTTADGLITRFTKIKR